MSYIRAAWGLRNIKGISRDYIYGSQDRAGNEYIEDYGGISDSGLAELLCDCINEYWKDDDLFRNYLRGKLVKRIGVELREKPATFEEIKTIIEGKMCPMCLSKKIKQRIEKHKYANGIKSTAYFESCKSCGFKEHPKKNVEEFAKEFMEKHKSAFEKLSKM